MFISNLNGYFPRTLLNDFMHSLKHQYPSFSIFIVRFDIILIITVTFHIPLSLTKPPTSSQTSCLILLSVLFIRFDIILSSFYADFPIQEFFYTWLLRLYYADGTAEIFRYVATVVYYIYFYVS